MLKKHWISFAFSYSRYSFYMGIIHYKMMFPQMVLVLE